jgi:hypothetical protein
VAAPTVAFSERLPIQLIDATVDGHDWRAVENRSWFASIGSGKRMLPIQLIDATVDGHDWRAVENRSWFASIGSGKRTLSAQGRFRHRLFLDETGTIAEKEAYG